MTRILTLACALLVAAVAPPTLAQAPLLPSHEFRLDAPALETVRDIDAPPSEVWRVWTTAEGFQKAIGAHLECELRPGGKYEIHWAPTAPAGSRGSEGCVVLSLVPERTLSFTWNAPPNFASLRDDRTWVTVDLRPLPHGRTRMTITHLGFGEGEQWDTLRGYFVAAWNSVGAKIQHAFAKPADPSHDPKNGWVYMLRLSRPELMTTTTQAEKDAFAGHSRYLSDLTKSGAVIVAGPCTGELQIGLVIFEAKDEASARAIMEGDPGVVGGVFTAELHPMRLSLVRDRDAR